MNAFFLDANPGDQGAKTIIRRKASQNASAQAKAQPQADSKDGVRAMPEKSDTVFQKVYQKMAEANKRAHAATSEQTQERRPREEKDGDVANPMDTVTEALVTGGQLPPTGEELGTIDVESLLAQVLGDDVLQGDAAGQTSQGWELIREALAKVSDSLHLNLVGQLDQLNLQNPDGFVIQQFADIVQTLKAISGVLDEAVANNEALNLRGQLIEPAEALALQKSLGSETFKLELGLKMIGIGSDVAQQAAAGQDQLLASEIPTAVKPSSINQPSSQISQLFSGLIDESQEQIKAIIEKTALTAASGKLPAGEMAAQNVPEVVAQNQEAQKPADVSSFHTSVMRKLLKIEGEGARGESGASSAEADGKTLSLADAVATPPAAAKTVHELAEMLARSPDAAMAGVGERGSHMPLNDIGAKATTLSYRGVDEAVMQQIIDRMHSTVRNNGVGQQEIRIHLRPESLGEVHLKIQMEGDIVMAKIHVESQQVKQIVESHLQSLRNALQEHNLQTGSLDVSVGQDADHRNQMAEQSGNGRKGQGGSSEAAQGQDVDTAQIVFGQDTGRRYGENSFEFFA
jgi:flagellar hook-length control protein FliK